MCALWNITRVLRSPHKNYFGEEDEEEEEKKDQIKTSTKRNAVLERSYMQSSP